MRSNPYARFASTQLILRDQLAIDRTVLANERTFLSYLRTALAFALTGAGCLRFSGNPLVHALGLFLIVSGLVTLVFGSWRTYMTCTAIRSLSKNVLSTASTEEGSPIDAER